MQAFSKKKKRVEALGSMTVKSQTKQFPSPAPPEVKQDVSQMESADANRI